MLVNMLRYFGNHFFRFYGQTTNVYLTLNEEAQIINFNRAATILLSHSNLAGEKLVFFIHPADRKKFLINHKYLLRTHRKKKWKVRIKQPTGNFLSFELLGVCSLNDEQNLEILIMLTNSYQHKQAEKTINFLTDRLKSKIIIQNACLKKNHWQLKQSSNELANVKQKLANKEAMLDSIFNAAFEGIITIDQFGTIVSSNKSITTLFGYQQKELVGANISILIPLPYKNQYDNTIKKYLANNQTHIFGKIREIKGQCKDGSILTLDLSIAEFTIKKQRYLTGMLRDVSERKRKEIKDKEHLTELAHVTRLGLMGEMASGIAHEVNQPLTAIAAYTQTCLKLVENNTTDPKVFTEILQKINKQSLLAGQIIHQVKNLVSSKKVEKSLVNINDLIREVVELCKHESEQTGIKIKYNLAKSLPFLFIDSVQIEQVLLNLIRNGFEALYQTSKNKYRQLEIQTYRIDNHYIEVRVKDFGSGLNDSEQANIFKPFYTTKKSGMGMGLSISRSIIEAHNGTLRFNSKKGFGTTFYFKLPINEETDGN